jgi:hypothetical protein
MVIVVLAAFAAGYLWLPRWLKEMTVKTVAASSQ